MTQHLHIDFVSDVACPWCAIGLFALREALDRVRPEVTASLRFQPFELNPNMWPGGQDITEHLSQKYGSSPEQQAQIRSTIRERGAAVGFAFRAEGRGRIYNTFNAHRLLYWAGEVHPGCQWALKEALLLACHRDGQAMDNPDVLVSAATAAGLDGAEARHVLDGDAYAQDVRQREAFYTGSGIHSVPAVIVNDRYLISGGQPIDAFEQALRQIAAQLASAA